MRRWKPAAKKIVGASFCAILIMLSAMSLIFTFPLPSTHSNTPFSLSFQSYSSLSHPLIRASHLISHRHLSGSRTLVHLCRYRNPRPSFQGIKQSSLLDSLANLRKLHTDRRVTSDGWAFGREAVIEGVIRMDAGTGTRCEGRG